MKLLSAKILFLALLALGAASCSNDSSDYDEGQTTMDNTRTGKKTTKISDLSFKFGDDGIPYAAKYSNELDEEKQKLLANEVIGYGWKHVTTREILSNGKLDKKDFWEGRDGGSPQQYFFDSESEMTSFNFYSAIFASGFSKFDIDLDYKTGVIRPKAIEAGSHWEYRQLFNIFKTGDDWHIIMIEHIGVLADYTDVWGVIEYARMTDDELSDMREYYTYDADAARNFHSTLRAELSHFTKIDPTELRFTLNESGEPKWSDYGTGFPGWIQWEANNPYSAMLSYDAQHKVFDEVIGYGWKYKSTNLINENGTVEKKDYWEGLTGGGPTQYFFKSAEEHVEFYFNDAKPAMENISVEMTYDEVSGQFFQANAPSEEKKFEHYKQILAFFKAGGEWHLIFVDYIGITKRNDKWVNTWGVSEYIRMTDEELAEAKKTFNYIEEE